MAWCPNCKQNVQIIMNITSSINEETTRTNHYVNKENGTQRLVGYEEGVSSNTELSSEPRCSFCFRILRFPHATSASEYDVLLEKERRYKHDLLESRIKHDLERRISDCEMELENHLKAYYWSDLGCLGFIIAIGGFIGLYFDRIIPTLFISISIVMIYFDSKKGKKGYELKTKNLKEKLQNLKDGKL